MPIYAYRCASCGHDKDVIQKFSDTPLTLCPVCGADAFRKQLTAPSFQLKGSGWYVTDFRDQGKAKAASPAASATTESAGATPAASAAPAAPAPSGSASGWGVSSAAPAAAPAKPAST